MARGEITALDLADHYLSRIRSLDGALGAFVTVTPDLAVEQAAAVTPTTAAIRPGALTGVPVAVKDMTATAGVPTRYGSAAFADQVPTVDAHVVTQLREAGLVLLGKTATSELGLSVTLEDPAGRPVGNPWDCHVSCGGSSGGAAVAVAAGLASVAHGTDLAGSVRVPAAMCGLVGYKPSRGLVSWGPDGLAMAGLATSGVLARTVADAAALLDVLSQPVPGEPYPVPARPPRGYLDAVRQPERTLGRRLRIGRFTTPVIADAPVDQDCVQAVDLVAEALSAIGHEVVPVRLPADPALGPALDIVLAALVAAVPVRDERLLRVATRRWRRFGAEVSAVAYLQAVTVLQRATAQAAAALAHVDLLLCPTLATPHLPVDHGCQCPTRRTGLRTRPRHREVSPYCAWFNITGAPALSLPVAQDRHGLPVGVMLGGVSLAASGSVDARLLAVAGQLERAMPWRDRHPEHWYAPARPADQIEPPASDRSRRHFAARW